MTGGGWVITVTCTQGAPVTETFEVDAPGLLAVIAQLRHPAPPEPPTVTKRIKIASEAANVRAHASIRARIVHTTGRGIEYTVLAEDESLENNVRYAWAKVAGHFGEGWTCTAINGAARVEWL